MRSGIGMPRAPRLCFDSNVFIDLVRGRMGSAIEEWKKDHIFIAEAICDAARDGEIQLFTCALSVTECLYIDDNRIDDAIKDQFNRFFDFGQSRYRDRRGHLRSGKRTAPPLGVWCRRAGCRPLASWSRPECGMRRIPNDGFATSPSGGRGGDPRNKRRGRAPAAWHPRSLTRGYDLPASRVSTTQAVRWWHPATPGHCARNVGHSTST